MFQYRLYGLNIKSSRPIKLLNETKFTEKADLNVKWQFSSSETPDKTYNWKPVSTELLDKLADVEMFESETETEKFIKVAFRLPEIKELNFILDEKIENLSIQHDEKMLASDIESHFVGPVLSFVLRLRGTVCLHSSAVAVDGKAILFTGHATAGKSTLAAGMSDAGAEIIADDIAVLRPTETGFLVQPGYSKVRLRPKAAAFLTVDPESLPKVYSYREESRYSSLDENGKFAAASFPLAAIYVLGNIKDEYREPFIEPLKQNEKLLKLIENTSGSYVVRGKTRANEFKVLSEIAKNIPVRQLFYAHEIETLPAQCELILSDFRNILRDRENLS